MKALLLVPSLALPVLLSAQPQTTALVGGDLIDGTGRKKQLGVTVVIRGERIVAVGNKVKIPEGSTVIDVTGKTLIPGLFDMHGHYYGNTGGRIKDLFDQYARLYLAGGVTTTFSPGDHGPAEMLAFRDAVRRGEKVGPRILAAGPYLDHAPSNVGWIVGVKNAAEARAKVTKWSSRIDGIKVYTRIREDELLAVLDVAHRRHLRVVGHLGSITATRAIQLGIDGLEHGIFAMSELATRRGGMFDVAYYQELASLDLDGKRVQALIRLIVANRVAIDPTLVIFQTSLPDMEPVCPNVSKYFAKDVGGRMARQKRMMARLAKPHGEAWPKAVRGAIKKSMAFIKRVHDAGGIVTAGTDPVAISVLPGYGLHRELRNFVEAGLTPIQAIKAATHDSALVLGRRDLGTIAAGKIADVVVIDGDPSADIEALNKTAIVFRSGRRYDPAALRRAVEGKIQ